MDFPQTREGQIAHYAAIRERIDARAQQPVVERPKPKIYVVRTGPTARMHVPKLEDLPPSHVPKLTNPIARAIIKQICEQRGVSLSDVFSKSRKMNIVACRQRCYEALNRRDFSLPRIARMFGVDHSTVAHGLGRIGKRRIDREEA